MSGGGALQLTNQLLKKKYTEVFVSKENRTWRASAYNPLTQEQCVFESLGPHYEAAKAAIKALPSVPDFYVRRDETICPSCGKFKRTISYSARSGDVMGRCNLCKNEWIESTAEEEEFAAKARMDEALEGFNELFNSAGFTLGKKRPL